MPYRRKSLIRRKGRGIKTVVVPHNPNNMERAVRDAAVGVTGAMINQAARQVGRYARSYLDRPKPPPRSRGPPKPKVPSRLPISMGEFGGTIKKSIVLYKTNKPVDKRTLKLGFNHRVLRFQRCNVMNAGIGIPGATNLSHGTFNTNQTATPCFVFCLNHTNNQSTLTTGPMYHLRFTDTGNVDFGPFQCQNADGTYSQNKWIADYASPAFNAGVSDPEVRYIMNAWYDIRLNCYGANAQPTIYDIMVVSFNEDYLDPYEVPVTTQELSDRHALYQGLVQKYMSNPLLPFKLPKNKFKVHARTRFTLQASTTIDSDQTPANKIVKLFVRDGSLYDYAYHGDGFSGATADDKLSTTQFIVQNASGANDYSDLPAAKARKWLIIRALNTTRIAVGSETRADTPSFDIIVRKGEYLQAR